MKFYQFDEKSLEAELDTDLKLGLTEKEANHRYKEFLKSYNTRFNFSKGIRTDLSKSVILTAITVCIYLIFALFYRNTDYLISGISYLLIYAISAFSYSYYIRIVNRKFAKSQSKSPAVLNCVRDGKEMLLKYDSIVFGDIVYLKKGDFIPFDARIISQNYFFVDETAVTGEKIVKKHEGVISDDNVNVKSVYNSVFGGSYVVSGSACVVVTDVGERMYINKSLMQNGKRINVAHSISLPLRLLILVLLILSTFFSIVGCAVTKNYINIITLPLTFFAVFSSGVFTRFIELSFVNTYLKCVNRSIYFDSLSSIERINSLDIMLVNQESVLEDNVEFSGFMCADKQFCHLNSINKNNFQLFLYSAFCSESDLISDHSIKMLKKIQLDFSDIKSVCPILSKQSDSVSGLKICARAYEGKNLLIARGNYKSILPICDGYEFEKSEDFSKLESLSDEIIAVAIKREEIVPIDLLSVKSGYELIGFIGIKHKFSDSALNTIDEIKKMCVHCIVLYPGTNPVLGLKSVDCDGFASLSVDEIKQTDIVYNYSGDLDILIEHLTSLKLNVGCFGKSNSSRVVRFESDLSSSYECMNSDVVCSSKIESVKDTISLSTDAYIRTNVFFENIVTLILSYIVTALSFLIFFKKTIFTSPLVLLVSFGFLIYASCISLYGDVRTPNYNSKAFSKQPLQINNLFNSAVIAFCFFIVTIVLKFATVYENAGAIMVIAITVCMLLGFVGKMTASDLLYMVPLIIIVCSIGSGLIPELSGRILNVLVGVLLGIAIRAVVCAMGKLVKI